MSEEKLTFEDGIIICKHIYQCAIQKTLNGVPEQWDIFYKTHETLEKLGHTLDNERLNNILFQLNMEDVYTQM
jgi:hypothetical protein